MPGKIKGSFLPKIEEINPGKANIILFPDKKAQVKESETKYRWMLKFLIGYMQKNKLRNNAKVSKQIGRQVSQPKPYTDKVDIEHQDKVDQIDIQAIIKVKEI